MSSSQRFVLILGLVFITVLLPFLLLEVRDGVVDASWAAGLRVRNESSQLIWAISHSYSGQFAGAPIVHGLYAVIGIDKNVAIIGGIVFPVICFISTPIIGLGGVANSVTPISLVPNIDPDLERNAESLDHLAQKRCTYDDDDERDFKNWRQHKS